MSEASTAVRDEIWELTIPGRVHVEVINVYGRPQDRSVEGTGSRLRISTMDRELNEERIRNADLNPFRNGALRLIDGPKAFQRDEDRKDMLSDDDLANLFTYDDDDEFRAVVADMGELNVRRMMAMARGVKANLDQVDILKTTIEERWPIGGTQPTYEEMQQQPAGFRGGEAAR